MSCLRVSARSRSALGLLHNDFFLQILGSPRHILRAAEIAPIIFIGAESKYFFSLRGETQVRANDGKRSVFGHHRKKARRNNLNAGKCQRLQALGGSNKLWFPIAASPPAAEAKPLVEQEVARGLAVLYG